MTTSLSPEAAANPVAALLEGRGIIVTPNAKEKAVVPPERVPPQLQGLAGISVEAPAGRSRPSPSFKDSVEISPSNSVGRNNLPQSSPSALGVGIGSSNVRSLPAPPVNPIPAKRPRMVRTLSYGLNGVQQPRKGSEKTLCVPVIRRQGAEAKLKELSASGVRGFFMPLGGGDYLVPVVEAYDVKGDAGGPHPTVPTIELDGSSALWFD